MFFYIDESGNTGNNLFDSAQPVPSYGLLSCATNVDILARGIHKKMLARLGVSQLHANELREEGLVKIADLLLSSTKSCASTSTSTSSTSATSPSLRSSTIFSTTY
jgi:hypothetical protein